ncbi:MAG: hypothetical protein JNL61_20920 [Rhizobiaceae bacterium]|nr:hypothetical protein [Rhizobiaceae bacterium]
MGNIDWPFQTFVTGLAVVAVTLLIVGASCSEKRDALQHQTLKACVEAGNEWISGNCIRRSL